MRTSRTETPFGLLIQTVVDEEGATDLAKGYHAYVHGRREAGPDGPGFEKLREGIRKSVRKSGRVLSDANLKLVLQALDALRELVDSTGDLTPTAKAYLIKAYGDVAQDAGLPLARMAASGDVLAGHYVRAALGDDDLFVSVIAKVRGISVTTGGSAYDRPACINPAVESARVCGQLFAR